MEWEKYYNMAMKLNWEKIDCRDDIEKVEKMFRETSPRVCAFDTETTGLNITKDTPFLMVLSWKHSGEDTGIVVTIDWTVDNAKRVYELMLSCAYIVMHNTKYDLHMMRNGGAEFPFHRLGDTVYLTDNMILSRLLTATDSMEKFALKSQAVKYIDASANATELDIKAKWITIKKAHKTILNDKLKPLGWTYTKVAAFIKNDSNLVTDLPTDIYNLYNSWLETVGEGNYYDIYLKHEVSMINYALNDGVYTLELFLLNYHRLSLETEEIGLLFQQENKLIPLYYEQEKHGFSVDLFYLNESRIRVNDYIKKLEAELHGLLGETVSAQSSKKLTEILRAKFNVPIHYFEVPDKKNGGTKQAAGKEVLFKIQEIGGEVGRICQIVLMLRTAKKWLSTYIKGILVDVLDNLDYKYHPSSLQTGTVTGRITGSMQQMPRNPMMSETGEELFHPRKVIIPSGNGYNTLVMQDFDQMELRVQAHYTIEAGLPDVNLLSLFIPYGKVNLHGEEFDLNNPNHVADIFTKWEGEDRSIWSDRQTYVPWVPEDPHGMHVKTAFGYNEEHPDWKDLRNCAKTINFAINYGGGLKGLLEHPALESYSSTIIKKIYDAYKTNFVGVEHYKKWVERKVKTDGKISNKYGRIYRVADQRFVYKVGNYMIQGSCADLLKSALISIDKYIKSNRLKSRVLYTVHDELIWELYKGEELVIKEFNKLLNDAGGWSYVPLTCGTDTSTTNWAEKKEYKGEKNEL